MFVSLFQQILMEKSKTQTFLLLSYLNLKKKSSQVIQTRVKISNMTWIFGG